VTRQSLLDFALGYADRGWHVFVLSTSKMPVRNCGPCSQEGVHDTVAEKEGCPCLTCHGFYAATIDPDRITEMIRRQPRGLLAIRTGAVSGLAVVDVDIKSFDDSGFPASYDPGYLTMSGLDAERLLPGTVMQSTGSGGLHFLYAHPGPGFYLLSGAGKYGPGVDSKADGGYIVVAPSVSRSGPYTWTPDGRYDHAITALPEALADRIRPPAVAVVTARKATGPCGVRTRLGGLVAAVLRAPVGQRNDLLHWAAKKAGEMVAAGDIDQRTAVAILQDAGTEVGLTATEVGDDIRGTIGSGFRKGLAARSAA